MKDSKISQADPPFSERKRVLLVDGTPENLTILIDLLSRDFNVLVAESGERALYQLQYTQPDIILLDVLMPNGIDGFETYRRIRAVPKCMRTPVLFLSAAVDLTHRMAGFDLGAVDYVTKPFYPEEVRARVELHCRCSARQWRLEFDNRRLLGQIKLQKAILQELEHRIQVGILVAVKHAAWKIEFCSHLASRLFEKHFDRSLNMVLPEPLHQSIEQSDRSIWRVPNGSGTLLTSFYSISKEAFLITLEEQKPGPKVSLEALYSLGLTHREAEVLFWIAEGKTSPEIGIIIGAAPTTIKKHVNHILEKLGVETRLSAALMANDILRTKPQFSDDAVRPKPNGKSPPDRVELHTHSLNGRH